jgi:anti-sigma factor RsiW
MSCDELYERLTDFVEGTLQGDICQEVEQHLSECHDCQHVRQDLEDLARLCRQSSAPPTMPDVLRQRILVLLAEEETPPRRPSA